MTPAALKRSNEDALARLGIAINPHLPEIEPVAELTPRSATDVVLRTFVLSHFILAGYGHSGQEVLDWLGQADLQQHLTPIEANFLAKPRLTTTEKAWAAWHAASVHACAWALQLENMEPLQSCPETLAGRFPSRTNPRSALQVAALRPIKEIHACADLYYRLHWAARDALLTGHPFVLPEAEVAMRRRSLDWISGLPYEWDDVPNDT